MNTRYHKLATTLAMATLAVAGCAEAPPESGSRLRLMFSPLFLSGYGATHFDVALLGSRWRTTRPSAVFEATCQPYGTDGASIGPLPTGTDLTAEVTFYSDSKCKTVVLRGARGGIEIAPDDTDLTYFVPVFPKDGFRAFPQFDPGLRDKAKAVACKEDLDCRVKNPGDGGYQLSAVASCEDGKCTMPESTYPLDLSTARSFHTATALADGRIALIGGVGRIVDTNPTQLFATDETVEVFDPTTLTFETIEVEGFSGQRVAMHAAALLPDGRLGVYGGAQQIDLDFVTLGDLRGLKARVPVSNFASDGDNVSSLASAVDLTRGTAETATLPKPLVGLQATLTGTKVLITGGATVEDGAIENTGSLIECSTSAGKPDCETTGQLEVERAGHCAFCVDTKCESVALVGGHVGDGEPKDVLAEVWTSDGPSSLDVDGDLSSNVILPTCAGQTLIGGASALDAAAGVPPTTLAVSGGALETNTVTGLDQIEQPFRVYSAAAVLADGTILVTGGLDDTGRALNTAYRIEDGKVIAAYTMAAARFGHTATLVTTGPLKGAVLVAGGLATDESGAITIQSGAELFLP